MVWLIGAGNMAIEYARVLLAQEVPFICITRSTTSAESFANATGEAAISGGLQTYLNTGPALPTHAIVATDVTSLAANTELLVNVGVPRILVEKPAALTISEALRLAELENQAAIFIAYNRRFYESVLEAERRIAEDGGLTSLNYELTEWASVVTRVQKSTAVLNKMFVANTSHVVDLAFFIGGKPAQLSCFTAGSADWHPASTNFAGAGVTAQGALFAYTGNWDAPGRWSLEFLTKHHRYIFRPMEKLQIQQTGSVAIASCDMTYWYDEKFKPGVYLQVKAFIDNDSTRLCRASEQAENMEYYYQMAGYTRD